VFLETRVAPTARVPPPSSLVPERHFLTGLWSTLRAGSR
jgi:hypothetical protein